MIRINDVINNIPGIIQYFLPGFLALWLYKTLMAQRIAVDLMTATLSCCFSFLAISVVRAIPLMSSNQWLIIVVATAALLVCATVCSILFKKAWFENFMLDHFNISLFDDVLSSTFNAPHGAYVCVYLKDRDYCLYGYYSGHDGEHLRLSSHRKAKVVDDETIYSFKDDDSVFVVCPIADIEYFEVSKKLKEE